MLRNEGATATIPLPCRLSTMSDAALHTRINRITNTAKMEDFVRLLEDSGRDELAEAARSALDALLARL